MTPLPKRRLSTRRQRMREKGLGGIKTTISFKCKNCGELVLPHHVCRKCGSYDGRQIIEIKVKRSKEKEK